MTDEGSARICIKPGTGGVLSPRSQLILSKLAEGIDEAGILNSGLSRQDVMRAGREALLLESVVRTRQARVEKMLRQYPRAYEKWSPDEEQRVAGLYRSGKTLREIASVVQRQPNAVKTRLERLGLFSR